MLSLLQNKQLPTSQLPAQYGSGQLVTGKQSGALVVVPGFPVVCPALVVVPWEVVVSGKVLEGAGATTQVVPVLSV